MLSSLERESDETENSYVEASRVSEGKLNKVVEAENKIDQLQKALQSLEEKLRSVEAENQILRKLAFSDPTIKHTREEPLIPKNVHNLEINFLINCVSKKMGFSQGKPIAAITIYRCLLHWKSFEAERTTVFDHLITMIGNAIKDQESNEHLAYWLSNTTYLLHLLQLNLKVPGIVDTITREKPPTPTLLRRMAQGFRSFSSSSIVVDELDLIQQVEAKYPALLFKQQLPAYMEKIYGIIRDNVKKEMESLLALCIQPSTAPGVLLFQQWGICKSWPVRT